MSYGCRGYSNISCLYVAGNERPSLAHVDSLDGVAFVAVATSKTSGLSPRCSFLTKDDANTQNRHRLFRTESYSSEKLISFSAGIIPIHLYTHIPSECNVILSNSIEIGDLAASETTKGTVEELFATVWNGDVYLFCIKNLSLKINKIRDPKKRLFINEGHIV